MSAIEAMALECSAGCRRSMRMAALEWRRARCRGDALKMSQALRASKLFRDLANQYVAESQQSPACPLCDPWKFAVELDTVPEVRPCEAHVGHHLLDYFNQPALRRRPLTAAEHSAFPNGRWL